MLTPEKALDLILEHAPKLLAEDVSLESAIDRVLAQDLYAKLDLPLFDNSAMDGFAVRVEDVANACGESPVTLKLKDVIRAGQVARVALGEGETIKVMTGAPLPQGAQAVVMKEHVRQTNGRVVILRSVLEGENIRPRGEDVRKGEMLLKLGTLIRPYEIALLAAQGISAVRVVRRPNIAVAATGDELVDLGARKLQPGQIRNSNAPAIMAALTRWGAIVEDLGIIRDDPAALETAFREALDRSDVVIVSGGVSVGDFDYTKETLERLGLQTIFWRVAVKPGKPLLFGKVKKARKRKEVLVFGVPGNPVSTLVCLEEFVRPAIEKMQGHSPKHPSWHLWGAVDEDQQIRDTERRHYLFSQVREKKGEFAIHVIRPQGSAMLGMAVRANALALVEAGTTKVKRGEKIPFRWVK